MNDRPRQFYVVHDERGRILALAPIVVEQVNERIRIGYRPVPKPDQKVTEIELTDEHATLAPHELLGFEVAVDPQTGRPHLRRPARPNSKR
jgi:hypothetical protein